MRKHYKRFAPPCNIMKGRLQQHSHRLYLESMPELQKLNGEDIVNGKDWLLYTTVCFVKRSKHPGPVSGS